MHAGKLVINNITAQVHFVFHVLFLTFLFYNIILYGHNIHTATSRYHFNAWKEHYQQAKRS